MPFDEPDVIAAEAEEDSGDLLLEALTRELALLRKVVLRQGHAQELFQARVEEAVARSIGAPAGAPAPSPFPNSAQVRTLVELDQAILQLLRLAEMAPPAAPEEAAETAPRSLSEG